MLRALLSLFFCCALLYGCAGQTDPVPASPAAYAEVPSTPEPAAPVASAAPAESGVSVAASTPSGLADGDADGYDDFADFFDDDAAFTPLHDPFEGWNRFWFGFNDVALRHVFKPLYKGWEFITPREVRSGISNFFHNLAMPIRVINCLLQGKFNDAGTEVGAFMINTVVGLGGFIDVASRHEEVQALDRTEDFGQTLGAWGMGEGPYLIWPLLGPSNLRDTVGLVGDFFMNPLLYMDIDPYPTIGAGVNIFNSMGDRISTYEAITDAAIEPYFALRDAYTQYRRARIKQ